MLLLSITGWSATMKYEWIPPDDSYLKERREYTEVVQVEFEYKRPALFVRNKIPTRWFSGDQVIPVPKNPAPFITKTKTLAVEPSVDGKLSDWIRQGLESVPMMKGFEPRFVVQLNDGGNLVWKTTSKPQDATWNDRKAVSYSGIIETPDPLVSGTFKLISDSVSQFPLSYEVEVKNVMMQDGDGSKWTYKFVYEVNPSSLLDGKIDM